MDFKRIVLWLRLILSTALILLVVYNPRGPETHYQAAFLILGLHFVSALALAYFHAPFSTALWFQQILFLADVLVVSLTIYLVQGFSSDLYLAYFLVILTTALTRSLAASLLAGVLAALVYGALAWHSDPAFLAEPTFFLIRLPFLIGTGSLTGFMVHKFMQIEGQLEAQYRERLIQMDRLVSAGQVTAAILHEIKAPVSSIHLASQMLLEAGGLEGDALRKAEIIRRQSEQAVKVAVDFLNFVRSHAANLESLDIREPIKTALQALDLQINRSGKNYRVDVAASGSIPAVRGDRARLLQVFNNLFSNALQAMPDGGGLTVSLSVTRKKPWWLQENKPRDVLEVVIRDTGCGIAKENLNRVFEAFRTTKGEKGNGLGLTVVQWILQKHQGAISVSSAGPNMGTAFILEFPVALTPSNGTYALKR